MQLQRLIGLALLVGGIVLLILGIRATDSFSDQVSKFFTGSYSDRAIWMIVGGAAAFCVGLASAGLSLRNGGSKAAA